MKIYVIHKNGKPYQGYYYSKHTAQLDADSLTESNAKRRRLKPSTRKAVYTVAEDTENEATPITPATPKSATDAIPVSPLLPPPATERVGASRHASSRPKAASGAKRRPTDVPNTGRRNLNYRAPWRTEEEIEKYKLLLLKWITGPKRKSHRLWCQELNLSYNRLFSLIYTKRGTPAPLASYYSSLIANADRAGSRYGKGRNYGNPNAYKN